MFEFIFYFVFGSIILTIIATIVYAIMVAFKKNGSSQFDESHKLPNVMDEGNLPKVIDSEDKHCEYCGSEVAKEEASCPACGAKRNK